MIKALSKILFLAEGRLRLEQPLYVEQPHYILLDRRYDPHESTDTSEPLTNLQDPFWVTRGRRQQEPISASGNGDPFWASMQGLNELLSVGKPFRGGTSPGSEFDLQGLADEPFWSTRVGRSSFNFLHDLRSRYGFLNCVSGNGPCWSPRGRRSTNEERRDGRGFLETLSAEEPFWAARGKKSILQDVDGPRDRRGLQELLPAVESSWLGTRKGFAADEIDVRHGLVESLFADKPIWAAFMQTSTLDRAQDSRSKRGLLGSVPVEEPYWAARASRSDDESEEKRGTRSGLLESLSAEEPFWAARGRRHFRESLSAEEPFWAARGKKESPRMTSPSQDDFLSQVSSLHMRFIWAQTVNREMDDEKIKLKQVTDNICGK
jgi:uncharacterized membrane protein